MKLHEAIGLELERREKCASRQHCEKAALKARIQAAIEVYAGMEGFIPETAAEGYCLRIIEQMNKALQEQTP